MILFPGLGLIAGRRAPGAPRTKLNAVGHNLGAILFGTVLSIPTASLKPALNHRARALLQILGHHLGLRAENDNVVELGVLLSGAGFILPHPISGQAEAGHCRPRGETPALGVAGQIAD